MKRKILNDRDIRWLGKEVTRLSYDMIFRDEESGVSLVDEERIGAGGETAGARTGADDGFPAGAGRGQPGEETASEKRFSREEVDRLLEEKEREWREKMEKTCQEVYRLGKEEGVKTGFDQGVEEAGRISAALEEGVSGAVAEWKERARLLDPGLLDLAFDISEKILERFDSSPAGRSHLENELAPLLQRLDEATHPVLRVSEKDLPHLEELRKRVAPEIPVVFRVDETLRPGEYRLESDREAVVRSARQMLEDFRKSLSLPGWDEEKGE